MRFLLGLTAVGGFLYLCLIGLPIAVLLWSLDHWYTAPIGILAVVLAVLYAIGRRVE